ncbi:MAG TPA: glycosyltransferase [Streptosporangiaceae bacterium]|nr:glycosyltransferase [Streptosporangiaceae bacterium]
MSPNESYPQHVVTAVIVAHDGAAWLPHVADALLDQTRSVQRIVAVDTGSRDRSGAVLASKFGQPVVFGMDRGTSYGAAIARALGHRAANVPVPGAPGMPPGDRVEWIWLLHDDCEPAPDALEQLLRGAAETNAAAVLGPKLRDWFNREVILEAGITIDSATRRVTGIEPREVDQGQHDGDRDTLAVSSAGMLVRRDVWEQVGGFDVGMGLFMEDIDFCWRVHSAGYRVRVITDAVAFHAQAVTKHRRAVSVGRRPRLLDRRNGLLTLLGNLPFGQMLRAAASNVVVSALRIAFFLLAKRLTAALDEAAALVAVLCHPIRLIGMRRRRSRGRRAAYSRVRTDLPPGRSVRRLMEFTASAMARSAPADTVGAHHASADPTDDDSLLVDNGLGRRLLTSPALLTFVALLVVAMTAGWSLLGSGPLGGGSLVPQWGGAFDLWRAYAQAFHPSGVGSAGTVPPYVAIVAILATLLGGKPWLAIDVLLIGCVPLAGMTAMFAVRRVTTSVPVRVWASVSYALLPVATGVIASGRFGTAVAFVLLPLIALQVGRVLTQSGRLAGRAAWAAAVLVAVGAAFVPLLWVMALVACCVAAAMLRNTRPGALRNLAVVAATAPVLLLPWSLTAFTRPASLLLEAGLPRSGSPVSGLPARSLILLSPGGPGLPPYWVTGGLLAAALAALFAGRRRKLIMVGWGTALAGMLVAVAVSHLIVRPADGGPAVAWAGLPLALAALGLLLSASVGADGLGRLLAGRKGWRAIAGGRGPWAAIVSLIACSAPVLAAASWLSTGVTGPVHPVSGQVVPELVAVADGQSRQVRTLVLRSVHGHVSYLLLRGASPTLADVSLIMPSSAQQALGQAVAALTTPDGGMAANQSQLLADFDIGYVLLQAPIDQQLAGLLNDVSGLRPYSTTSGYALWQLTSPPARVSVLEPNGTMVPIASGQVSVSGASVPAVGGILMLAEPVGGWSAEVNGSSLTPVSSPAGSWAQAYKLPAGGGTLRISRSGLPYDLFLLLELLAAIVVIGLGLPGIHVAEDDHAVVAGGAADGQSGTGARPAGQAAAGSRTGIAPGVVARAATASTGRVGLAAPGRGLPDAQDEAGAGGEDDGKGRRAALVAATGLAGSVRSRGSAGRGRAGKAGRGKAGRDRSRRDGPGSRDQADRDRAGRRGLPGPATGDRLDRDRQDGGLADLDLDRVSSGGLGRPGQAGRRREDEDWPGAAQDPQERRAGRAVGPQARAWPYLDDADPAGPVPGRSPAGSPAEGSAPSVRPPSGRSPSGMPPPAASPPGRPLEGGMPPADRPGPVRDDRGRGGRAPAGSWLYGDPQERQERPPLGRQEHRAADEEDQPGKGRFGWRLGTGLGSGRGRRADDDRRDLDRTDRDGYDRDGADEDRSDGGRHGRSHRQDDRDGYDRGRADRFDGDVDRPGYDSYEQDRYDGGRRDRDRPGRHGRNSADDDQAAGIRSRSDWDSDRSGRPAGSDRWRRRGREDRSAGSGRSAGYRPDSGRTSDSAASWPGGSDALEPLPPIEGPSRESGRASAWRPGTADAGAGWDTGESGSSWQPSGGRGGDRGRPFSRGRSRGERDQAADGTGEWDQVGDVRPGDQRWSAPEPDYEGETW